MYETILVPTDGASESDVALTHAIDLASRYDAALHTLHVVEQSPISRTLDEETAADIYGSLEEAGQTAVCDVTEQATDAGVDPVEGAVVRGTPHEEILTYIEDQDVDLVVMATAGRTGTARELIGSVTERVVRVSPVPVVTVAVDQE